MMPTLRRWIQVYGAFAAMALKTHLAYTIWVWMEFFVQILSMVVFIYFWRAVYAGAGRLGGLSFQQMLDYILLAQVLLPLLETRTIFDVGRIVRSGDLVVELARPVDFQGRFFVERLAALAVFTVHKLPLLMLAWLIFGLHLPTDLMAWCAFLLALLLGQGILFYFDWIFACLAFYTTEIWGLEVARVGIATFFSGALIPLVVMPSWLRQLAASLPFAQAIYVPATFLSGITPLAEAPRFWLVQVLWLAGLGMLSRWVFRLAARKVTVQGG